MLKLKHIFIASLITTQMTNASPNETAVTQMKSEILKLAQTYQGQGDPDQSKQAALEVLVEKLVQKSPMPPIRERIPILAGAWKQIFGPYEYRNDDGSVDPKIGVKEIYQVVFADGYYYNVAPYYPDGDPSYEQVSLLRGEFQLDDEDPNGLQVKFTDYPGVDPRPAGVNIWDLAAVAEAGQLENEITIVPKLIVKLFFRGGKLEEIYTDHDMRILYGQSRKKNARRSIYIMTRMN